MRASFSICVLKWVLGRRKTGFSPFWSNVILPTLTILLFGALVLAFLCVSLTKTHRGITPLAILVAACTVQSALIALVMHFEMEALRWALPV